MQLNDTDGEEAKGKEREETGELQGIGNPGESGRGGKGRGGNRTIIGQGKSSKLNLRDRA